MVTLRQLRYFLSLAKHCHFGRAARENSVSQPALSTQIREFERQMGAELVERRHGEVVLTETGREVAERAEHILAATRDLVDITRHREVLSGPLKLGIIPTLAPYMLPRLLPQLQKTHAVLRLDVRETQTAVLVQELLVGDLDCLLVALPIEGGAELETHALFEDRFLFAAPASERLPRRRLTVDDVNSSRLFLLEEGHCLRDQALAFCATRRREGPTKLSSTSLATVMQMVANGYGSTLLPEIAADVEARDPRIKLARFAAPEPARTIGLAWRRTSARRKDFVALGDIIRASLGALSP